MMLLILIVASIVCSSATAHVLWIQFDGSLRAPQDFGFPACPARIGTAAAALIVSEEKDCARDFWQRSGSLWLGGRALKPGLIENSAAAEYEGLLLGSSAKCS